MSRFFTLGDRLPGLGWAGIAVSFAGVVLIVLGDSAGLSLNPFALLILVSALATAFFAVLQKPLFARYRAVEVTAFLRLGRNAAAARLFAGVFLRMWRARARCRWLQPVYIGVFPAAIAYAQFSLCNFKAAGQFGNDVSLRGAGL